MIACRHAASISQDPHALGDYYAHILRLADETQEPNLCYQLKKSADDDFRAYPDHGVSQLYRGVTTIHLLGSTKVPWSAKEKIDLLASAKKDLEAAHLASPDEAVGAGHLALLRLYEIMAMPQEKRLGPEAVRLAKDAQGILDKAQSANPGNLPLAVMAARVRFISIPVSKQPADAAVRRAVDMARAQPAAVPMDLQMLCYLCCTTLTTPVKTDPKFAGHTEGQQLAFDMAHRHAVEADPRSTLALHQHGLHPGLHGRL